MSHTRPSILYIITQGHWGGAQRYVCDLATSLADDVDVTVAVGDPKGSKELQSKIQDTKIQLVQLKHLQRAISPLHDLLAIFELRKLYKKIQPDIIHLNSSKASIIGSFAATKNDVIVYTAHGWVFDEPLAKWKKTLYRWLEAYTAKRKAKIITLSDTDESTATQLGIPADKRITIAHGIETPNLQTKESARTALGIDQQQYTIGCIANLYRTKGIDVLVEAFATCENKEAQLIILGDGPERKNIEQHISHHKLEDRVHLAGFKENASELLSAFDLFVLPSRKEGLPYALLEAQAAAIPILATDVGGVHTIIENKKTGLLVPAHNSEALATALTYAAGHPHEMNEMAAAGNEYFKHHFDKPRMIERMKALYTSLQ